MNFIEYKNKVFIGDTLNILRKLPDNVVDLGVTSPPYNKGEKQKGWLVKNVKYDTASDNIPEDIYQQNQIDILNEIYRITKNGGSFFYNHKIRWNRGILIHPMEWIKKTKWIIRQEIIWDRTIAANIRGWRFWQIDERIYWLQKPDGHDAIGKELKSKHALLSSIWRFTPEQKNSHPAPFPLTLPARIIYSILDGENGLVIDPYCGSGTTLIAAKLLNCDYIGIDISKEYITETKNRLTNVEKERFKIDEEKSKHVVKDTFKNRKMNGKYTCKRKKQEGLF